MKFKLGQRLRDKITGFEGTVVGYHRWLTGCDQYSLLPESKDNKPSESGTYDEGRLEPVGKPPIKPESVKSRKNGCDMSPPIKN